MGRAPKRSRTGRPSQAKAAQSQADSPNIWSSWQEYNSEKFTWIMVDLKIQKMQIK